MSTCPLPCKGVACPPAPSMPPEMRSRRTRCLPWVTASATTATAWVASSLSAEPLPSMRTSGQARDVCPPPPPRCTSSELRASSELSFTVRLVRRQTTERPPFQCAVTTSGPRYGVLQDCAPRLGRPRSSCQIPDAKTHPIAFSCHDRPPCRSGTPRSAGPNGGAGEASHDSAPADQACVTFPSARGVPVQEAARVLTISRSLTRRPVMSRARR